MFDLEMKQLQADLDRIYAGTPPVPDWRKTEIGNNRDGIMADARRFLQPDWWRRSEPNDPDDQIIDLVRRKGLGTLRIADGVEEENVHAGGRGVTAAEVVERQQNKEKVTGHDEGEDWRAYMGEQKDDAREWLKELSAKVDVNVRRKKGWAGTLRDHIFAKPNGAKIRDLDPRLLEVCLKNLCEE